MVLLLSHLCTFFFFFFFGKYLVNVLVFLELDSNLVMRFKETCYHAGTKDVLGNMYFHIGHNGFELVRRL
jgi:hypothetical protein